MKTDRRDARALAEACLLGAYRPAHPLSDPQGPCGAGCWSGTPWSGRARAISRSSGPCSGSTATASRPAVRRALSIASGALPLPGRLLSVVAPLLALMRPLNRQLSYSDATIEHLAVQDPRVPRLRSVPSVGPVAAIDDAQRFRLAHQLEAYLGLVPREYSSGETQRRGAITKAGHSRTRGLLIQSIGNTSPLRRRSLRGAPPAP